MACAIDRPGITGPRAQTMAVLLLLALFGVSTEGVAQAEEPDGAGESGIRMYVGMWTTHLTRPGRGFDANWLLAMGWRGYYGGTFINSYGKRAFAAGIERSLARSDRGAVARGVGYRLGLVTGYDQRLLGLARWTPVLPVLQVMGSVAVGPAGLEVAWAGRVASLGPYLRVAS
jgi:hypothetical protein